MLDDPTFQKYLAIVLVAVSASWLIWRAWMRRKKNGCGGDRACPADDFKRNIRRKP